ncbi:hypothetical protein CHUAL_005507 [Chamberlinius hualienensis]
MADEDEKKQPLRSIADDDEAVSDFNVDDEDVLPLPKPPDGGWGWVIVFASFMCNLIVDGIAYSFGVFFLEFDTYFGAGKSKTSWAGSLLSGCYLAVGPIASALTNKFGCRPVTIAGSIIGCVAFILSQFSPNIDYLMLTYGVMGGIGFGLIYLPAIVSVGYYFEKKRALATGIAVCGSGVGTFIFAPLSQVLLAEYGWKGALTILAGLILNCMVCGALMRPLEVPTLEQLSKPLLQRMAEEKKFQMERGSICGESQFFMVQLPDGTMERRPKIPINLEPGVHSSLNLDQFGRVPETPVTPLPTIAEGRIPDQSRTRSGSNVETSKTAPPVSPNMNRDSLAPSAGRMPNGIPKNYSLPVLEGMVRRNVVRTSANGAILKMSQSNQLMDGDNGSRKYSLQLKQSASGANIEAPNNKNNNVPQEMWIKVTSAGSKSSQVGSTLTVMTNSKLGVEKKEMARPMSRKDIFYSGSIVNLPEYAHSQRDMATYRASVTSLPKSAVTIQQVTADGYTSSYQVQQADERKIVCWCLAIPTSMTDTVSTMLDFSLLKDPVFLLIGISNVFGMLGFYVPFVYITDLAILRNIEKDQAAFLLSIIGIINTFGRLFFGWLTDRPNVDSLLVNNISLLLAGVCIFLVPFGNSYALLVTICVFFGLFISAYVSLTSIILVDLLGLEKLTNAFGLLILFRGAASIVGPPLAGALYDATGTYDISFYAAGALIVISAILSFMIPCVKRCSTKANRPKFSIEPEGGDDGIITSL